MEISPDNKVAFNTYLGFNILLVIILVLALLLQFSKLINIPENLFETVAFIGLLPVAYSAILAIFKKELTIDLLAAIALIYALLAREWYSAAFINLMLSSARIFDLWTQQRTANVIQHLLKYRPEKVKVQFGNQISTIPLEKVAIGDLVIIEAGERIPVDGEVVSGQASINESTLTGESMLVDKKTGSKVFSSTLNESGSLIVKTTAVGKDSTLSKIISLVEDASRKKSKAERIASSFTQWYVLATLIGSVILFFFTRDLQLVLAVLLVVCADDIAVAVPLSFTLGIVQAAKKGVIIKGSSVLENLSKIKIFITDKTGTLTYGRPEISKMDFFNIPKKEFLTDLGIAEANSTHPFSVAAMKYLKTNRIFPPAPDSFREVSGEGIKATYNNKTILAGKVEFLTHNKIQISQSQYGIIRDFETQGLSLVALGSSGKMLGLLGFEDKIRPNASSLVAQTKKLGVKKWLMLTGDHEKAALKVSEKVGIDQIHCSLKPEGKLRFLEELKHKENVTIAMIGDGVNDAASLALADVSFAMGAIGTDTAIEAADVALMHDNLERIPEAMLLGQKTNQIIKQIFGIWATTNLLGLILVFTGVLNPVGAATYNFVTDFFPILNALRVNMPSLKK